MITDIRGSVDYFESGKGPTVVLVPGSCSTGAVWKPIMTHIGDRFRCVTTSLLGYGGSTERRSALNASIVYEAEILEAVICRAAQPVHLVGHSFGGLTALAVALRRQVPVLSLMVIEAPAPQLLWHMGEHAHYCAFRRMTDIYFAAAKAGSGNAIETMIDFYGGAGTFASWPQRVRDYAVETTAANQLDWEAAYDFQLTPIGLGNIDIRSLVVWGANSHPAVQRVNELLAYNMPNASTMTIEGAAHFMVSTHPKLLADVIAAHIVGTESILADGPAR